MLDFTADWLQRHTATADRLSLNVMVESFAIHVRNLIQFLRLDGGRPQNDDLDATTYVSDPAGWLRAREMVPGDYCAAKRRASKRVAHLTKKRRHTADKGWSLDIVQPLREQEILFFNCLKPEHRQGSSRNQTTFVRVLRMPAISSTSSSSSVSVSGLGAASPTPPDRTPRP